MARPKKIKQETPTDIVGDAVVLHSDVKEEEPFLPKNVEDAVKTLSEHLKVDVQPVADEQGWMLKVASVTSETPTKWKGLSVVSR